jgi:hypothetical protein
VDIEDVRRIVVHPGETLVFRVKSVMTAEHASHLGEAIRERLPEGVRFLVVSGDVDLEVVADAVARA